MIPPQELILEACLETPEEVHSAFLNGAHRVELCRNLESGGLAPQGKRSYVVWKSENFR